jgi:biofilm PGA synthesis N-glycosyltransferase PgaC
MKTDLLTLILGFGLVNLLRIVIFMIASDIHEIKEHRQVRSRPVSNYLPGITVVIPAYNEERSIRQTLESVLANTYPRFEIVVVDDGSTDGTSQVVREVFRDYPRAPLKLVRQKNAGKSHALNNALRNNTRAALVMCLDADSRLAPDALAKAALHFRQNPSLVALASNMKIDSKLTAVTLAQKIEYMVANRFKRSLSLLNIEYIIGGIGSTFRRSYLERIGYYDTDTMTEDIDLSMKIINQMGNTRYKIDYGYDVHTYTQAVPNLKDLIQQRFRWKYGRMQTFYKNRNLFFSSDRKHSKLLTHFQLPYAVLGDVMLTVEPLVLLYILFSLAVLGQPQVIIWGMLFMALYVAWIVISSNDDSLSSSERFMLIMLAPLSWFLFYIITLVDFCAYVRSLRRLPALSSSLSNRSASWDHVQRIA